jgi:hypothetical protein
VKKPSRLAILLLVTGVPAFSFWPLVGLFLGPGFIVPLFAATAWLADSCVPWNNYCLFGTRPETGRKTRRGLLENANFELLHLWRDATRSKPLEV